MALVNDNELNSAVRNKNFSRVYYLYGKNVSAVESTLKLIISKAIKKDEYDYNYHSFDGKNIDICELTEACEALPMMADYVCCTVCNLNAETLDTSSLNTLIAEIKELPDKTILIFYNTSIDVNDGKRYPTAKNKKLIDAVSKSGTVCIFDYKSPSVLAKDIISECKNKISKPAAEYLAEICGCNTMIIKNEIDKLIAFTQGNEITIDIINMLTPRQLESTSFDLAKSIARHDKKTSIKLFNELVQQKIEPISILYAMTGNMIDLYRAKTALSCGKSSSDVKGDFGYTANVSFRVDNAFRDVKSLSLTHMRECMRILTEADIAMKSLKTDKNIILEKAIIKMLSSK